MYELRLSREAEKILRRLQTDRRQQIERVFAVRRSRPLLFAEMSQNPFSGDVKKLRGTASGSYRRRVGALRIMFQLDQRGQVIWVETLGFRGDVYK